MGSIFSKLALLIMMIAILIYTVINYANGETSIFILGMAAFIFATSGSRIIAELIKDIKNR